MSDQPYPPSAETEFAIWRQDIERRLKNLETGAGMVNTSVRGGTTRWVSDDDGKNLAIFGIFGDSTTIFEGFAMYDGDGETMFMTRGDKPGIIHPHFTCAFERYGGTPVVVTSGTFVPTHVWGGGVVYHDGMRVGLQLATDSGTTGEVRLREVFHDITSSPIILASASAVEGSFRWKHQVPIGDACRFEIQARRTSGAGNVNVYNPLDAFMSSTVLAGGFQTDGHPQP